MTFYPDGTVMVDSHLVMGLGILVFFSFALFGLYLLLKSL